MEHTDPTRWRRECDRGIFYFDDRAGTASEASLGMGTPARPQTIAKIQAGNTWELSAVPYIPAIENVARHVVNLGEAPVDGFMLGWTLGGYPSPNLEIVAELAKQPEPAERTDRK